MCRGLSWLQSLFHRLEVRTGPPHPRAAAVGALRPWERQSLSINQSEDPWGTLPPAPLSLCNSEGLNSVVPPRRVREPLSWEPAWDGQSAAGQSCRHSPSCTAHRAWHRGPVGSSQCHVWEGKTPSLPAPIASVSALPGLWQHLCANSLPCPPRWLKTT